MIKCMAVRAKRQQILRIVLSDFCDRYKVVNIKRDDRSANWIATFVACLVQNTMSDVLRKCLAYHGFVGPNQS